MIVERFIRALDQNILKPELMRVIFMNIEVVRAEEFVAYHL